MSCFGSQGDRGPKGLKGLKGAAGFKVNSPLLSQGFTTMGFLIRKTTTHDWTYGNFCGFYMQFAVQVVQLYR